ncbi:MAG: hypothetical protein D6743_20155 [Calditrichaeota bacterium]|nr:MAG: hypothetical protein D6743_20155 [Calditrichota bacterium]
MIEPKIFYRDFDHLLKKIRQGETNKDFLCHILLEVQNSFGEALHLGGLQLYEDRGDEFVLIESCENGAAKNLRHRLKTDSEAVKLVLRHGSYIYDDGKLSIQPEMGGRAGHGIAAAMVIRSGERRWIAVYKLRAGWTRDEVLFALNAIRTTLSYRLFSQAIETDLEQAAEIQRSLLPARPPEVSGYQIAVRSQPAELVGGDLYDFFEFDDDVFGVCIGDASGHGLPAALLVRDIVIGLRMGLEKHMKMVYTFKKLNEVIYKSTFSSRFVSLFYADIEKDGHMIYVNGGHPAPFIVCGDKIEELKATGLIIGALPDMTLHRAYAKLEPNAVLVLYSDGLFERESQDEELFKIQRLQELVKQIQEYDAEKIVEVVFQKIFEFGSRSKWEDDSTLVVIKRLPT